MIVDIGWPNKLLWPNGSEGSAGARRGAKKKAREAASWAAVVARQTYGIPKCDGEIPITLVVHAMPKGPLPDKDNCIAAVKVQLDAIAEQIGVNDRQFAAPVVEFAMPRNGRIFVHVGKAGENFARDPCLSDSRESSMKEDGRGGAYNTSPRPTANAFEERNG